MPQKQGNHDADGKDDGTDDSILLWSDNPEKEYFEYMLQQEQEQRANQGKSAEDSLLGDSTIADILQAGPSADYRGDKNQNLDDNADTAMEGFSLATTKDEPSRNFQKENSAWGRLGGDAYAASEVSIVTPVSELDQPIQNQPSSESNKELSKTTGTSFDENTQEFPFVIYVAEKNHYNNPSTPQTITSNSTWHETKSPDKTKSNPPVSPPNNRMEIMRHRLPFLVWILACIIIIALAVAIYLAHLVMANDSNNTTKSPIAQQDELFGTDDYIIILNVSTAMPTLSPTLQPSVLEYSDTSLYCGCQDCTSDVLSAEVAELFSCHDRINILVNDLKYPEQEACRQVVGVDNPTICSPHLCDPTQCQLVVDPNDGNNSQPVVAPTLPPSFVPATISPSSSPTFSTPQPTTLAPSTPQPTTLAPSTPRPSLRPTLRPTLQPTTASPTNQPTQRPSTLNLVLKGNNGQPSNVFPLGMCEGDCDNDQECQDGLICYHRSANDPIPVCLEGEREGSATDFCVPEDATLAPTTARPSPRPTRAPTPQPTSTPRPTRMPTRPPTREPTWSPTKMPTFSPTDDDDDDEDDDDDDGFSVTGIACSILGILC